jgi:probable F420-dependent oxidoreductase
MPLRPFRFAVTISDPRDRAELIEFVRRAEDTGFDVLAAVDHIGPPLGVLPLLAAAAEISNLRVSPMVIANDYRNPVLLAKDAATIDVLSDGRFELGIGTGWIKDQYGSAGIRYDPASVRVDRLEEALAVIKGCWTGRRFTFAGEHYQVDVTGSPVPVQRPHPPILVGAAGPRMLGLAGRTANIVGFTVTRGLSSFDSFGHAVATSGSRFPDQLVRVRTEAGDGFADIELSVMIHVVVGPSSGDMSVEAFADTAGATRRQVLESPHVLAGSVEQMADALIERRERWGLSYIVVRGAQFDDLGPVVVRLAGT